MLGPVARAMDTMTATTTTTNQKKTDQNPVDKKRFFLEIKNAPHLLKTITDYITLLGGRIESFLNNRVHYVVTNRAKTEWPQRAAENIPTSPHITNINSKNAFSRASKILKSTHNVPKTSNDPLEMARRLDKKIIYAQELIDFLKKHNTNVQINDNLQSHKQGAAGTAGATTASTSSVDHNHRKLLPPYIKVVDNSYKYKTNFKELAEWPEINYDYQPELCPFYKSRKPSLSTTNVSQQSNKSGTVPGKPNDRFQTVLTTPILNNTTTPTLNNINTKSITKTTAAAAATSKRKHMTFCELCQKEYDDFEKHMNDDIHAGFLANESNFAELFSVIKSLPPFLNQQVHILNKSSRSSVAPAGTGHHAVVSKNFADISNLIPLHNEYQNSLNHHISPQNSQQSPSEPAAHFGGGAASSRKMPSPLMRSINLINTCTSKHSFMAIHELVNDENDTTANGQHKRQQTMISNSSKANLENDPTKRPRTRLVLE